MLFFFCHMFRRSSHVMIFELKLFFYVNRDDSTFTNILNVAFFVGKFRVKLFLYLHFRFELFWHKNIGANLLIKCWWNWPQWSKYNYLFSSHDFYFLEYLWLHTFLIGLSSNLITELLWRHSVGSSLMMSRIFRPFSTPLPHLSYILYLRPKYGCHKKFGPYPPKTVTSFAAP
jgi:hypothetical protein